MDTYRNPTHIQTNNGVIVEPAWNNNKGVVNSHIVYIDSRLRDYDRFPNANDFELLLPTRLKGVRSIELLNARIPVITAASWYGGFSQPEAALHVTGVSTIESGFTTSTDLSTVTSYGKILYNSTFDKAFARIPLNNVSGGFIYWGKDELRAIYHFNPVKSSLDRIHVTLKVWGANVAPTDPPFDHTRLYPTPSIIYLINV